MNENRFSSAIEPVLFGPACSRAGCLAVTCVRRLITGRRAVAIAARTAQPHQDESDLPYLGHSFVILLSYSVIQRRRLSLTQANSNREMKSSKRVVGQLVLRYYDEQTTNAGRFFVRLAFDDIRRRALSTSACFCNSVMSRASSPRVFQDKTADWICWRAVSVNFFPP